MIFLPWGFVSSVSELALRRNKDSSIVWEEEEEEEGKGGFDGCDSRVEISTFGFEVLSFWRVCHVSRGVRLGLGSTVGSLSSIPIFGPAFV